MALRRILLPLAGLPFVACAFLLDFDELQQGGDDAGASGGSSGSGDASDDGSGGVGALPIDAGDAGARQCEKNEDCSDDDPCTTDTCIDDGPTSHCNYAPAGSVVDDGFALSVPVQNAGRVTLAALGDQLYVSTSHTDETTNANIVTLNAFTATGSSTTPTTGFDVDGLLAANSLDVPLSVLGLFTFEGSNKLHAVFGARKGAVNGVYYLQIDPDLAGVSSLSLLGNGYGSDRFLYPHTGLLGNEVTAVWRGTFSASILIGSPNKPATSASFNGPVNSFAALHSDAVFGAAWVGGDKLNLGLPPNTMQVNGCAPAPAKLLSTTTSFLPGTGLGALGWTKTADPGDGTGNHYYSELALTACDTDTGCEAFVQCPATQFKDTRNPGVVVFSRGTPKGAFRLYTALALPSIPPAAAFQWNASLALGVSYVTLPDASSATLGSIEVAAPKVVGYNFQVSAPSGPDRPVVIYHQDRLFVGWVDHGAGATDKDDVIHVNRYRLECQAPS